MKAIQHIIVAFNSLFGSGNPTEMEVMMYIASSNIQQKEVVAAQAITETMYFKCKNCSMQMNNLFGFRTYGYLRFKHWSGSIDYYEYWQKKRYKGGDYYDFLKKVKYAQSEGYNRSVKSIERYVRRRYGFLFDCAESIGNASRVWDDYKTNFRITIFAEKAIDTFCSKIWK